MDICLLGMHDRSMQSGTELAWEIKRTDWSMAGNLSNRSSGVQILRDICTRLRRYLYSAKCSWIIMLDIGQVLFFVRLWAELKSRSINMQKKELGQYPAVLTKQANPTQAR